MKLQCEDENGNLITCQKVVEKLDDFQLASNKHKRDYYSDWLSGWYWNPWNWWYNSRTNRPSNGSSKTTNKTKKSTKTIPKTTNRKVVTTPPKRISTTKRKTTSKKVTTTRKITTRKVTTRKVTTTKPKTSVPSSSAGGLPIDKRDFSMTGFINCSSEEAQKIRNTINDITIYRAAGLYVAKDKTNDQANQIFLKYFKSENTRSQVIKVLENVNNMKTATAYCEPNTDSACAQQAIAWTYLRSKEFHVCPSFFTKVWHGTIEKHTSEAASVILHELTHCHGTDDYAYGDAGCNKLDASKASNNADSFRLFCMNSIYYLNDKKSGKTMYAPDERIDFRVEPWEDKLIIRAKPLPDETQNALPAKTLPSETQNAVPAKTLPGQIQNYQSANTLPVQNQSYQSTKTIPTQFQNYQPGAHYGK